MGQKLEQLQQAGKIERWLHDIQEAERVFGQQKISDMEEYLRNISEGKAAALLLLSDAVHNNLWTTHYLNAFSDQVLRYGPEQAKGMREGQLRQLLVELRDDPALLKDPAHSAALRVSTLAAGYIPEGSGQMRRPVLHEMYNAMADAFEEARQRLPEGDDRRAILEQAIGRAKAYSGQGTRGGTMQNWPANIESATRVARAAGVDVDRVIRDSLQRGLSNGQALETMVGSSGKLLDDWMNREADGRLK